MGADEVYMISDRAFGGSDTWATSNALAAAIRKIGDFKFIFAGRQAIDGDTAQVGPQIAEHLNLPSVSYVEEIQEIGDGFIKVRRQYEDRYQILKVKTPCLITTLGGMNQPRYMRVSRIYDSFREEGIVKVWNVNDIVVDPANLGLKGSPTNVKKSFTKGTKTAGKVFDVEAKEGAKIILDKLKEQFLI